MKKNVEIITNIGFDGMISVDLQEQNVRGKRLKMRATIKLKWQNEWVLVEFWNDVGLDLKFARIKIF